MRATSPGAARRGFAAMNVTLSPKGPARISRKGGRPLVSFYMAARNAEAYVEEALRSMLAQSVDDFELLALDDGSTDATFDVLMSVQDPRITVLQNESNLGIPKSLNRLLDLAAGEYLAHMDADDICLPHRLEKQLALMRTQKDIWVCGSHFRAFQGVDYTQRLPVQPEVIRASLPFYSPIAHPFATLRGDAVRRHNIRYAEKMVCSLDYELWVRMAMDFPEARFANIDAVLGLYRRHTTQISTARMHEQMRMATRAHMRIFAALGFAPTNKMMDCHRYIYHQLRIKDAPTLVRTFEWALDLRKANEKTRLFQADAFNALLLGRLAGIAEAHPDFAAISAKLLEAWPA